MNTYNILIKDIYTAEKRSETVISEDTTDIREIHKRAFKKTKTYEEIECIKNDGKIVYTYDRGFLI